MSSATVENSLTAHADGKNFSTVLLHPYLPAYRCVLKCLAVSAATTNKIMESFSCSLTSFSVSAHEWHVHFYQENILHGTVVMRSRGLFEDLSNTQDKHAPVAC